ACALHLQRSRNGLRQQRRTPGRTVQADARRAMMARLKLRGPWLLALPLTLMSAACSGDAADERTALRDDELARELDLALKADAEPVTFSDTVLAAGDPVPQPAPEPDPEREPEPEPEP